jgi:rhodanese-related sulfurtransferase
LGHLDGAVNVPVYLTVAECRQQLSNEDRGRPVVVYCQSAACSFAETIALKLQSIGFVDVAIYRGGWREWTQQNERNGS